jgi:activator of HSP90 ATPase
MAKNIVQKVTFKKTKPEKVYELYANAKKHSSIAGAPVTVSSKAGAPFSAWDGYIKGNTIHAIKDKLFVQTWRGSDWTPDAPDSYFSILLEPKGKDVVMLAIHANVPDEHAEHLAKGWHDHYWNLWKQHLAGKEIKRPPHGA